LTKERLFDYCNKANARQYSQAAVTVMTGTRARVYVEYHAEESGNIAGFGSE
jgi:hypothetical protein